MAPRDLVPAAATLRHRAGSLRRLAIDIERAAVFDLELVPATAAPRIRLCRRMLTANLQQLLAAADDLRDTAWQFETRARHLDGQAG